MAAPATRIPGSAARLPAERQIRGLGPIVDERAGPGADRRGAHPMLMNMRPVRTYDAERLDASMSMRWAKAGRRRNSMSRSSRICRARARVRAACITSPSARRTRNSIDAWAAAPERLADAVERAGGPLLFPQPAISASRTASCSRSPLTARLRAGRAGGSPRREAGAAALPRAAPQSRSRPAWCRWRRCEQLKDKGRADTSARPLVCGTTSSEVLGQSPGLEGC